ncbi:NEAT domain-containing protein [Eubacterium oxidoreducens]|nr:NEAT domain-containing protein [Eubacterium oxidoreducens]
MKNLKKWILGIICLNLCLFLSGQANVTGFSAATEETSVYYAVSGTLYQASSNAESMANSAIKQLYIEEASDGAMYLRITLQPVEAMGMSGYLGWLKYYEDYDTDTAPSASAALTAADVLSKYSVFDSYNNASSGSDSQMKGKSYPKVVKIPVDKNQSRYWMQVYVPLMEGISAGSGTQTVRLVLDYSTMEEVSLQEVKAAEGTNETSSEETSDKAGSTLGSNASSSKTDSSGKTGKSKTSDLDIATLEDGTYYLSGEMLKVDKSTTSMANSAINPIIKLTVKKGKYTVTVNFKGMSVGSGSGYLGKIKYYTNAYKASSTQITGTTHEATVKSYQKNSDGTKVSDSYGTDYPKQVTFPLIKKAIKNGGYVPLQVYVPVMEAISAGSGTQNVYLKLDYSTLAKKKSSVDTTSSSASENSEAADTTTGSGSSQGSSLAEAGTLTVEEDGDEEEGKEEILSVTEFSKSREDSGESAVSTTAVSAETKELEPPLRKYGIPGIIVIAFLAGHGIFRYRARMRRLQ